MGVEQRLDLLEHGDESRGNSLGRQRLRPLGVIPETGPGQRDRRCSVPAVMRQRLMRFGV